MLQGCCDGEMVPVAIAKLGALVAFRAHSGVVAEECGVLVAQTDVEGLSSVEARPSLSFKLSLNVQRAKDMAMRVRVGETEKRVTQYPHTKRGFVSHFSRVEET